MSRAEVVIDGDVGPLRRKLREGISAMNQFNSQAGSELQGLTGPMQAVAAKFTGLVAVIGGGAMFKKAIDDTVQFNREVASLARVLGISATEAVAWNVAIGDIYQDAESMTAAVSKLTAAVANNEEKLNSAGIATRNANGELLAQGEIFLKVTERLKTFTLGTDRNVETARIFGRGWADLVPLLNLTAEKIEEARVKADQLGLTMTEQSQGTVMAYRASMNDVGDVMQGLKNAIAQAVMPVLTRMGEWFASIGPASITILKGAIGGISTAFMGLMNGLVVVWETVKAIVYSVTEPIVSLGRAMAQLANGEFKAAADTMTDWPSRIAQRWGTMFDTIAENSRRTANDIAALWGKGTATQAPAAGGSSAPGEPKPGRKAPSQMGEMEAMLAKEKQALIEGGFIRQYEAEQELDFWKRKREMASLSAEDRLAIERKVATLSYEVKKRALDREAELNTLSKSQADALALSKLDTEMAASKALLDNDMITKGQYLQIQMQHDAQRYALEVQSLQDRLDLMALDPNMNPVELARLKGELLLIEQKYQRDRMGAMSALSKEDSANDPFAGIGERFNQSLQGMLTGATNFSQAMMAVFGPVRDAMIKNMVTDPVANYIAGLGRMLAVKMGFIAQEKAADAGSAAATVGIKGAETAAVASANAVQAGTGAAASQAGIPIVGPMLALAAMAAVFAAVSGMGKKSARGGYDIPAGINPMTQLHEEEMVLPQRYANVIRGLAGGEGGGGGGGDNINVQVHAMDARGVAQFFRGAGGDAVLREMSMRRRSNRGG